MDSPIPNVNSRIHAAVGDPSITSSTISETLALDNACIKNLRDLNHELRTPLSGILGGAQLLGMHDLSAEQRALVDAINQSALQLLNTIDHLLGVKRAEASRAPTATFELKKPKVLLVEDNPTIQKIHKIFLEQLGCIVDVVGNGIQALGCYDQAYHLVFMDLGLPDISGIEVTAEIRKYRNNLPVIALTAYATEQEKQRCLEVGFNEVMTKPTSSLELQKILNKWLPYLY